MGDGEGGRGQRVKGVLVCVPVTLAVMTKRRVTVTTKTGN